MRRILLLAITVVLVLLGSLATITPAQAQGVVWTAEYYDNTTLTDPPVATVTESDPTHNWGAGAPISGVGADNFSVRWTANIPLNGHYQFDIQANDGVRLWMNDLLFIDEWHAASGQTYSFVFSQESGTYPVVIEYYDATGDAFLTYSLMQTVEETAPTSSSTVTVAPTIGSWQARYYNNSSLSGSPTMTTIEQSPSHDWGASPPTPDLPADNFSVRWESTFVLNGTYRVDAFADDGIRVWVNGALIVDEWHAFGGQAYSNTFSLPAGTYPIVVEYYDGGGLASLSYHHTWISDYVAPPASHAAASGTATVRTSTLNVRDAPSTSTGAVLTQIHWGESYPIVGTNANSSWWQIQVSNITGWVYGALVSVSGATSAPVTGAAPVTTTTTTTTTTNPATTTYPSSNELRSLGNLNIRGGPGVRYPLLGRIPNGRAAGILGRTFDYTWWMVDYQNTVGWVSMLYVSLPYNLNPSLVPVRWP